MSFHNDVSAGCSQRYLPDFYKEPIIDKNDLLETFYQRVKKIVCSTSTMWGWFDTYKTNKSSIHNQKGTQKPVLFKNLYCPNWQKMWYYVGLHHSWQEADWENKVAVYFGLFCNHTITWYINVITVLFKIIFDFVLLFTMYYSKTKIKFLLNFSLSILYVCH